MPESMHLVKEGPTCAYLLFPLSTRLRFVGNVFTCLFLCLVLFFFVCPHVCVCVFVFVLVYPHRIFHYVFDYA